MQNTRLAGPAGTPNAEGTAATSVLRTFIVVVGCLCMTTCFTPSWAQDNSNSPPDVSAAGSGWTLVRDLSDEFQGTEINAAKWSTDLKSWNKVWEWSPDAVAESGGKLRITMSYSRLANKYTSGILRSRATILYGYFEAKIKAAPRFPGVSSAFWASPSIKAGGEHTEIDFLETGQHRLDADEIDTNTHVFSLPKSQLASPLHESRPHQLLWSPASSFHVYSCLWTPQEIVWYIDGKEVARRVNDYWHQPLNVNLSLGVRQPLKRFPSGAGFPTSMSVEYIRVWQKPGI